MKLFYPVNENDLNSEILPKIMKELKTVFLSVCCKLKISGPGTWKTTAPLQCTGSTLPHRPAPAGPRCCLQGTATPGPSQGLLQGLSDSRDYYMASFHLVPSPLNQTPSPGKATNLIRIPSN